MSPNIQPQFLNQLSLAEEISLGTWSLVVGLTHTEAHEQPENI